MLLEFKNVDTHYGDLHVLKDVNYAIEAGEIVALLGGNASGKSTTMKTIMGVVRPTRGQVIYDGQAIESDRCALELLTPPKMPHSKRWPP